MTKQESTRKFMDAYNQATVELQDHPLRGWRDANNHLVRLHVEPASGDNLQMYGYEFGTRYPMLELRDITSERQGSGAGTACLRWLCKLADEHRVALVGICSPLTPELVEATKDATNYLEERVVRTRICESAAFEEAAQRLKKWYRRHGFRIAEGTDDLFRAPRHR